MALGIIAAAATGAGVVYVWGWRRFSYLRAHWRSRRLRDAFVTSMRRLRDELPRRCYRAANAGELTAFRGAMDQEASLLSGYSFVELGDVVVCFGDDPVVLMRTFVDPSGTTLAFVYIDIQHGERCLMSLDSFTDGERFTTWFRAGLHVARPPYVHDQRLPAGTPVAELVGLHRAFARTDDPERGWSRVANHADLLALFAKFQAKLVAWRGAQPPEQLLEEDLRSALGEQYDRFGKQLAVHLRGELPPAVARRVPRPPD